MKTKINQILALSLALLIALPAMAISALTVNADEGTEKIQELPVEIDKNWKNTWYKFETPLITLVFPASGKKPMFLWWYTNDNSTVYVVKFKGVIEYLIFDKPYYLRRFRADNSTINATLWKDHIEPKIRARYGYGNRYNNAIGGFLGLLRNLHGAFLPFSACEWNLTEPELVTDEDASYWSFNFTLTEVYGHPGFKFAENKIQIRCRFYNTTITETPDPNYSEYNYTVAAGHLKFDFVVSDWKWNLDTIQQFFKDIGVNVDIPVNKTGLALWINMASINIEDLTCAENEVQSQFEHQVEAENQIEAGSQMKGAFIGDQYYPVEKNETATNQDEKPLELREQFRERVRICFAHEKETIAGFLEFVPWARLLNETGDTVGYVNVTASYIAAGAHLRLFLCYPYFGNYTLEHDPTIGLASAPAIPTFVKPIMLAVLIGATIAIAVAVAAVKLRKKPVNIVNIQ